MVDTDLTSPAYIAPIPTGTGFRHVTAGVEEAAAKLVENADVSDTAAIAQSKLNLTLFSGLSKISVSDTPPGVPSVGDLWVDTS